MLPRALNELYDRMRDFLVMEEDGEIVAVCALKINGEHLAENRSLAVRVVRQGWGLAERWW
jgi:amino-acid N-acetyltransferase